MIARAYFDVVMFVLLESGDFGRDFINPWRQERNGVLSGGVGLSRGDRASARLSGGDLRVGHFSTGRIENGAAEGTAKLLSKQRGCEQRQHGAEPDEFHKTSPFE